jgi:predicted small metal-binding protein
MIILKMKMKGGSAMADTKGEMELGCKDFRQNCDFTVRAKSEDEILDKCREHACRAHGKCDDSAETREKVRSRIREVL